MSRAQPMKKFSAATSSELVHKLASDRCGPMKAKKNGPHGIGLKEVSSQRRLLRVRLFGSKTSVLSRKEWQQKRPELFVKRVYDQTGLDN